MANKKLTEFTPVANTQEEIELNISKYFYEFGAYEPDYIKKKSPQVEQLSQEIGNRIKAEQARLNKLANR